MSFRKCFGLIVFIMMWCTVATATPTITNYSNNVTGTTYLYPHVSISQPINFSLTANETIVTWFWLKDGAVISNNFSYYVTSWSTKGYKNITAYGTNANGTTSQTQWHPIVEKQKASAANIVATFDSSALDTITDAIDSNNPNFEAVIYAPTEPYTNQVGPFFFLVLFGVPLVMIWHRTEKREIPIVLALSLGGLFLVFMPEEYVMTVIGLILLTVTGIIYSQFKERGT